MAAISAIGVAVCAASLAWAWSQADRVVPAAVREVAALDQEILAHVERSGPSALERGFFRLWLRDSGAQLVANKDASLSRRRYPSPYFLVPCGVAALWIVAATVPSAYLAWGGSLLSGLLVYTLVMVRRTTMEPVEIPGFIKTLPVSPSAAMAAKRAAGQLRTAVIVVLGGLPLLLRAPDMLGAGIAVGVSAVLTLVASQVLCRRL